MYTEEVKRFKSAVNKAVEVVDKTYLRELQAESHNCAASCCRDKDSSTQTLLHCVENCGQKLQIAQKIVLDEFDRLQDKFEHCLNSCAEIKHEVKNSKTDAAHDLIAFEDCLKKCVDLNIGMIPDLIKTMSETLNKVK